MKDTKEKEVEAVETAVVDDATPNVSDADMPEPRTHEFQNYFKLSEHCLDIIDRTYKQLPYNTVLGPANGDQIKLNQLLGFVEEHKDALTINELNQIIRFMAYAPYSVAKEFMYHVESEQLQQELWTVYEK